MLALFVCEVHFVLCRFDGRIEETGEALLPPTAPSTTRVVCVCVFLNIDRGNLLTDAK